MALAANQELVFNYDTQPWFITSPGNAFEIKLSSGVRSAALCFIRSTNYAHEWNCEMDEQLQRSRTADEAQNDKSEKLERDNTPDRNGTLAGYLVQLGSG